MKTVFQEYRSERVSIGQAHAQYLHGRRLMRGSEQRGRGTMNAASLKVSSQLCHHLGHVITFVNALSSFPECNVRPFDRSHVSLVIYVQRFRP